MRWPEVISVSFTAAILLATAAHAAGGIVVLTDTRPRTGDERACMMAARKALAGAGLVLQVSKWSMIGSNPERTITVRCDLPGSAVFIEAMFAEEKYFLDDITDAWEHGTAAPLIPAENRFHQYTVDCTGRASCALDAAKVCKEGYATSKAPKAKVLKSEQCADARGSYTCQVDYELDCN